MLVFKNKKSGFTLIELLVVISIIGLMSSIVLSNLSKARSKARDNKRISEMKQMQVALEFYYDKYGSYPSSGWVKSCDSTWNTSLGVALKEFLPNMPVDPVNECTNYAYAGYKNYSYFAINYTQPGDKPGQWYMIIFTLENKNMSLDTLNSSTDCVGNIRNYGGNDGYIITLAGNCVN